VVIYLLVSVISWLWSLPVLEQMLVCSGTCCTCVCCVFSASVTDLHWDREKERIFHMVSHSGISLPVLWETELMCLESARC